MRLLTVSATAVLVSSVVLFNACSKDDSSAPKSDVDVAEAGWASVNGSDLTEAELDHALERFFGDQFIDARAVIKVRESLIASRALAQKAEQDLDADTLASLEVAVNAYREERLIAAYIEQFTTPEPVSAQQVNDYYQSNLEEFGQIELKRFEVLQVASENLTTPAAQLTQTLAQLGQSPEWGSESLPEGFRYFQSTSNAQLPAEFRSALRTLEQNDVSAVISVDRGYAVLKVIAEEKIPAKPLAEVSAQIRRRLAATQLSKTVKELSNQIVSESDVIKNY